MKIFNKIKKIIIFISIYLIFDIIFFSILPEKYKSKLYNNRAHRIKSYYYHHDLRPMASFYDQWGYEKYEIFTNNLGFKDKYNRKVKFKEKNILFIGDSFTEGVGLKYEDTVVGIIDKNLKLNSKDIEVLNAGVQSYSTDIYLSKIYHLLERKKMPITDIVLIVSGGDFFDDSFKYLDLDKNYILDHTDQKNKYVIQLINFYKSNTLIYQFISRITPPKVIPEIIKSFFKKNNHLDYNLKEKNLKKTSNEKLLKLNFLNLKDYNYFFSETEFNKWGKQAIDKSMGNLKKIKKITSKYNINLNVLYIYEPILILKQPNKDVINYIISSFKKIEDNNFQFYTIKNYLNGFENNFEAYKNLFFIGDIHWNKKGNQSVAKEILEKIPF
tara:strand:- start:2220 stop:3371 length:1152 start_codon:yes stop_codon:yes gene_type:complete